MLILIKCQFFHQQRAKLNMNSGNLSFLLNLFEEIKLKAYVKLTIKANFKVYFFDNILNKN